MAKINTQTNMIPLVEDYYFTCDDKQYILFQCGKRNKIDIKTKKPTDEMIDFTDIVGYYDKLSTMLKACVRHYNLRQVQSGNVHTLNDCIKQVEELYSRIEKLTKDS